MKQKTLLGIFAFSIVAILGISMVSAFGFGHKLMNPDLSDEDKTEMQNQMETIRTAIENNDYETWKSLMEEQIAKMQEQITEDNFDEIVARHQEIEENRQACEEDENACPMPEDFGQRKGHMMQPHFEEDSE